MTPWEECLIDRAREIVYDQGDGELKLLAMPRDKDNTLIMVVAGKKYRFTIKRVEED